MVESLVQPLQTRICEQFKAKMSDIKHMITMTENFCCIFMLSLNKKKLFWAPNYGGKLGSHNANVKCS